MFSISRLLNRSSQINELQARADATESQLIETQQQLIESQLNEIERELKQLQQGWNSLADRMTAIESRLVSFRSLSQLVKSCEQGESTDLANFIDCNPEEVIEQ